MGVFKLAADLCEELEQMIHYFWWGEETSLRKIHWLSWEKLLQSKCHGGIGFKYKRKFNQALLAGPVILGAWGESKSWGLCNFFLINIGSPYANMMLLKIEKIIITWIRIIIGIRGLWVILHVQWCWIVIKMVDESTGSQLALDSPSSSSFSQTN
jgi:hypothetical protein